MKKHWLTLHGNTFLWIKRGRGFIYNTDNKKKLIFSLSDKIEKICVHLLKTENLYSIELPEEIIKDKEIHKWIDSILNIQAGTLSLNTTSTNRSISLKPILKIQDNKEYYEEQHKQGFKGKILQNLHELTFYINGSKYGNNEYYKQSIFPIEKCSEINSSKIFTFIKNSRNLFLRNINLVGDIFSYPDFEKLLHYISSFSLEITIHIMIQDFLNYISKVKNIKWPSQIEFNVILNTMWDLTGLQTISFPFSFTVFVFSENDFIQFSNILKTLSTNINIRFIPLYIHTNRLFFESNIFLEKEDLEKMELSKNEIFIRQALNTTNFGKLTVLPNGNVYANVNETPLGTLDESPYSIIYKEFTEGKSWLKVRDQAPCTSCIYQWMCPSPSNYEIILEQPNLCHVKPYEYI